MKMKALLAAGAALAVSYATPSHAGFAGYYLANFTYPGGTFQHCFALSETNNNPAYPHSGTWYNTDFPAATGNYVVFKRTVHLAGSDSNGNYLAFDGQVSSGQLINTTFDYFTSGGVYFAAGSFVEYRDKQCQNPD